jgi:hypothetical protein
MGREVWEEERMKVTFLRVVGEERATFLRIGTSGLLGGHPRRGGGTGSTCGGTWAGLSRWTEMESVLDPISRRKEWG